MHRFVAGGDSDLFSARVLLVQGERGAGKSLSLSVFAWQLLSAVEAGGATADVPAHRVIRLSLHGRPLPIASSLLEAAVKLWDCEATPEVLEALLAEPVVLLVDGYESCHLASGLLTTSKVCRTRPAGDGTCC